MSAEMSAALAAISSPSAIEPSMGLPSLSSAQVGDLKAQGPGFSDLVTQGLQQVNQQLLASQTDLQQLAVGNVQNLHQIMIRLEESKLSFQLMMQVRSRLLEAYQDVMKMQL
ncbi:flagellar hook-basal body complex protein FliE [Acidovorax sp. 1608163]|nr:flagellar hook-basal body complex protein FliE [Acidovorax sp. 1608163]